MSKLLEPGAVAGRVGLARKTLAKLRVKGGGPPFVKIGAKVLYPEAELEAWIAARPRHGSTASYAAPIDA
jgi:predicted DNA-binding transcriptional regulator AlpA